MYERAAPLRDRANDWDRRGLPAWTYHSPAMLELERQELFRKHWQIAGHVNNVAKPGKFFTVDIVDERAIIMRGDDGIVRAFHNLCRHRGSRVAAEKQGQCKNALVCPFHGWVYNFDGTLRGAARMQCSKSSESAHRMTISIRRPNSNASALQTPFRNFLKGTSHETRRPQ